VKISNLTKMQKNSVLIRGCTTDKLDNLFTSCRFRYIEDFINSSSIEGSAPCSAKIFPSVAVSVSLPVAIVTVAIAILQIVIERLASLPEESQSKAEGVHIYIS